MRPRACKTFSRAISVPKAPLRCQFLFSFSLGCCFFLSFNLLSVFLFSSRLVGGAGDIKLTKDGNTLLKEMVSLAQSFVN